MANPDPDIPAPDEQDSPLSPNEINDEAFQAGLAALLAGYQPILEEELKRAKDTDRLKKELLATPASCEEEVSLAGRIFERFSAPELSIKLLPPEAQAVVGPIEQSRWCLLHIRCCLIFGWLICRRPRNFRVFVYYLHRYW